MAQTPRESRLELRKKAEEKIRKRTVTAQEPLSLDEVMAQHHELEVNQIELEMQIDELLRTQHELDLSQARYFDFYNLAPVGYLTLNKQGIILEANITCSTLLGVNKSVLMGQLFSNFIYHEDQDIYYLHHKQLIKTEKKQEYDLRIVHTDGSFFWGHLQTISTHELDGTPVERMVISDITKQKRVEIELRSSKKQWERTFDAMTEIVTIQDKDMHIVRANKAAHQFFQVELGKLNGKHCYEVFTGASAPCSGCPLVETFQDGEEHSDIIIHENLGKIFRVSSVIIPGDNRDIQYILHVANDITEQKKMEEELFQAHKMDAMGTLAGGIAHDFNNILAAIMGFSELAKSALPEDSKAGSDIDQVITSSKRAANLVKQILLFSRKADMGRQALQPHLIVKEALKMLRATLPTTISMDGFIDSECGSILADPTCIHQIVMNLCTNAYHAMKNEKGTLTVNLCRKEIHKEDIVESDVASGPFIELSVQDTGCGLNKKLLTRIFEPYFTTKEVGQGSGIGLSVTYGIVKSLNGFIQVKSEPGKGSTFHIYIPAIEEVKVVDTPAKTIQKELPRGTERILFVDDEILIVKLNKSILERLGYKVTATTSSVEALDKVRTHADDFDLVITDQCMPNLSGVELTQEIMKTKPDMPIILCSGYSSVISEEGALALGIKKYLAKPVDMKKLAQMVREVLDKK